ncbi:hypothetical protein GQ607_016589 [Colletotrichum asianum]|uniref:Uncharacterized protein n=1 Tax=Colletotrichum asianum TaxID=702518 RepID=A0A8H3ZE40_9PEZI|nr:hypothetical protein GQ607_016589 [Colletotrichum asianum]
MVLYPHPSKGL